MLNVCAQCFACADLSGVALDGRVVQIEDQQKKEEWFVLDPRQDATEGKHRTYTFTTKLRGTPPNWGVLQTS